MNNIQGVTGAVYQSVDTSPQAVAVNQAMSLIQEGLAQLTTLITSLDRRIGENPPQLESLVVDKVYNYLDNNLAKFVNQNDDLQATVALVLQQADWAEKLVVDHLDKKNEIINDIIEDAVRDRMDEAVNSWFSQEFQLHDYVDIDDLVKEVVEDKLRRATITVDI